MWNCRQSSALLAILLWLPLAAFADAPHQGKNTVTLRGQTQEVYFYPGNGPIPHRKILFAPGDGGWRGFAVTIAENMAASGYDVFGLDTKRYLESFTGSTTLTPADIAGDYRVLAAWIAQDSSERVVLAGWSEGAGMAMAAAADPANQKVFQGVLAIGTTELNILALRWKDLGALLAKRTPNEPTFRSIDYVARIAPLPLAMIASSGDEYVSLEVAQRIFAAAREPKHFVAIDARNHHFDGNTDLFFRALREQLQWIISARK